MITYIAKVCCFRSESPSEDSKEVAEESKCSRLCLGEDTDNKRRIFDVDETINQDLTKGNGGFKGEVKGMENIFGFGIKIEQELTMKSSPRFGAVQKESTGGTSSNEAIKKVKKVKNKQGKRPPKLSKFVLRETI